MTMDVVDHVRGLANRHQELLDKWNYYQNLCRHNGYNGLTHMMVQNDKMREALKVALDALETCTVTNHDTDARYFDYAMIENAELAVKCALEVTNVYEEQK